MAEIARRVREVLAACLKIEPEGVRDSDGFFDPGLDSLGARTFADCGDAIAWGLGGSVSVVDVFQYPSVESFAVHVESLHR